MDKRNNWFKFAQEDLMVAKLSFDGKIYNQACFHSQQGIEKMLKGFLKTNDKNVPRVHSLAQLLTLCVEIDSNFETLRADCVKLDDYYIPTRYPDALPGMLPEGLPDEDDAQKAISILEEVIEFVTKILRQSSK